MKSLKLVPGNINAHAMHSMFESAAKLVPLTTILCHPKLLYASDFPRDTLEDVSSSFVANKNTGDNIPLGEDAYSSIGDMKVCKIINGMWQVSGAHGYKPRSFDAVSEMTKYASEGFTSFDLADIYGPAEDFVGGFMKGPLASPDISSQCQFFTKWVPRPQEITKEITQMAIEKSMSRMKTDRLDLLQFHWWDYNDKNYYSAIHHLMDLQEQEKIRYLGLTNFDSVHMLDLVEQGAPIVSNQVSFSILDTRPLEKMVPICKDKNIKLLCYGTLLGGFLSSYWLGKPEPDYNSITNISLKKYLPWIQAWGGWGLFQELLMTLNEIAAKHNHYNNNRVSISNIAQRWVLDQESVAGAIVGARFGMGGGARDHTKDNLNVFALKLDEEDYSRISSIQKKGKSLMKIFGDCGGEYRKRVQ